jgi:hypothetical protein
VSRLRDAATSLAAEARAMTRKMPGVHVAVLVYDLQDSHLAVVHDDQAFNWDALATRLKGTAEEIRQQLRSAK